MAIKPSLTSDAKHKCYHTNLNEQKETQTQRMQLRLFAFSFPSLCMARERLETPIQKWRG